MLLDKFLAKAIKVGTLTLIDAKGRSRTFGTGEAPTATVRLHSRQIALKLATNPGLALPEGFADGDVTIENGTIFDLLYLVELNGAKGHQHGAYPVRKAMRRMIRHILEFNPAHLARRNVGAHYDLSGELYALFLDADQQYSCGYFPTGEESLEDGQTLKKRHIAAKLLLEPGMTVLDIGCGWGGMALYLAKECGAKVVGITLSEEQHKVATERAKNEGLTDQVEFRLQDYRAVTETFDRIVSVGMFEHVGRGYYPAYFNTVRDRLSDDGVALIHTIMRWTGPSATNAFIRKYIFPGGYSPALSEILPPIEQSGLVLTDIEILRMHYADTIRHWRHRFYANRERVEALYDERFGRIWDFYLSTSELVFSVGSHNVAQIQLSKQKHTVPQTRDYITGYELAHPLRKTE